MRWKDFINKWVMRVKESRTVLVVGLWSIMAMVQVLDFVRPYLVAYQMVILAVTLVLGGVAFTYFYDKLGIMKGENRQRVRRKNNFVGESMMLNHLGMIHIFSEAFDGDNEEMMENYSEFIQNYEDGVEMNDFK